jgi:hypothetical protein
MRTSRKLTQALLALFALTVMASAAFAADPGLPFPWDSQVSDQKAGSVLYYNYYTSSTATPNRVNTRVNITNTNSTSAVFVHLFFVDAGCAVADRYICLTQNQTTTFLTSQEDPNTTGYLVAIAVNGDGCPINFNYLIGDEYFKTADFAGNIGAEAFSALYGTTGSVLPECNLNSTSATLNFNGVQYNRAPRVVALDNIPAPDDGNGTWLILNRVGGDLRISASTVGSVIALLFDDEENPYSTTFTVGCQLVRRLDDAFPRVSPRFRVVIPAGQSGWMKLYASSDFGLLGAQVTSNTNVANAAGAFGGAHNLHKLTLSAANSITIPIFNPACGFIGL